MENSYELLEKMDGYKNNLFAPLGYEKQSAKFVVGVRILDNYIAKFSEMKRGE